MICLNFQLKVVPLLHQGSVRWVHKKKLHDGFVYFLSFLLLLFFIIKLVLLSFSFLSFDKVSNYRNRTLTNQKHKLLVPNFRWNCMYTIIRVRYTKINFKTSDQIIVSAITNFRCKSVCYIEGFIWEFDRDSVGFEFFAV